MAEAAGELGVLSVDTNPDSFFLALSKASLNLFAISGVLKRTENCSHFGSSSEWSMAYQVQAFPLEFGIGFKSSLSVM